MSRHLQFLLEKLNNPANQLLIKNINYFEFFDTNIWVSMPVLPRKFIIWIYKKPLINATFNVSITKSFSMPIGTLHYLYSDTLAVGYIIDVPYKSCKEIFKHYMVCGSKEFMLGKVSSTDIVGSTKNIMNNKHLCILHQDDAMLIAHADQQLINFLGDK